MLEFNGGTTYPAICPQSEIDKDVNQRIIKDVMIRQSTHTRRSKKRSGKSPVWTVEPIAADTSDRLGEIQARLLEIEAQLFELQRLG